MTAVMSPPILAPSVKLRRQHGAETVGLLNLLISDYPPLLLVRVRVLKGSFAL
jgi:hypothetical protein